MMTQPFDDRLAHPAGKANTAVTTAWKHDPAAPEPESAEATLERINRLVARIHEEKNEPPSTGDSAAVDLADADAPRAEEVVMTQVILPAQSEEEGLAPAPDPVPAAFTKPLHDDDALQSYMDQFLERVTGKKKPDAEPAAGQTAALAAAAAPPPQMEKQREFKRAPESIQDLSQMRELANQNARHALGVHAGQRLSSASRNAFLAALALSLVSSALAATFLVARVPWAWTSAVTVMPLALILTWRYWSLRRKLAEPDDYPASQPAGGM